MRPRIADELLTEIQLKRRAYNDAHREHRARLAKEYHARQKEQRRELAKTPEGRRYAAKLLDIERCRRHAYYMQNRERIKADNLRRYHENRKKK